ncbi:sulfite oxidase [Edaphobacter modestus]|uniref:DMSO/TMAO reductase YedYZ molybdopterin-dependent catalytic subunit n=1 Tax=Edaphobacter modestus TaxID=388466 RepID=A0A4Q7YT38_9BACT|nr:sulfite oxidase [Edaphobacter modestus]RZU40201.1 DMSO/TMAO reductase YedYZ molybdopterin-dependent catalytic subunit [Edaphobacter modestus]
MSTGLARRQFLRNIATTAAALAVATPAFAEQEHSAVLTSASSGNDGFIIREMEPENLESSVSAFSSFITSADQFYVRNHFKQPELSSANWTLAIDGAVSHPLQITYAELTVMRSRTMVSLLECAGNGRVFLVPREDGAQWANGGMGNAEWTGIPLADVLKLAGIKSTAVDVIFEGADSGELTTPNPKSPGVIPFARSLPISEANHGDVLLAYHMNGKQLPPTHGFPVRLIVPGWYGMASVKWLKRITLTEKPFDGYFQSLQYSYFERSNGIPTVLPVTTISVKSAIIAPGFAHKIARGHDFKVRGMAWAGVNDITSVEVSTDAGKTWNPAQLISPTIRYSWRMWEFTWPAPSAGKHTLMARATDSKGNTQAMERNKDYRSYEITHVIPVIVEVL